MLDEEVLEESAELCFPCLVAHQFEGGQEVVKYFYNKSQDSSHFVPRLLDVNHQAIIIESIVECDEDLN